MRTLSDLMEELPGLAALTPEHRETIAGCARNVVYQPGQEIMREGDAADAFHVVREGEVAIVTRVPGRGEVTVETLGRADPLGWSWLVEPHINVFGARAVTTARLIVLDGKCLRGKCDADPALGYGLLKLLASVFGERLRDSRLRLLDLYGGQ